MGSSLKIMLKLQKIIEISGDIIKCKPLHPMTDDESIPFEIPQASGFKWKFPPYEKVLNPQKKDPSDEICFNVDNLKAICEGVGRIYPLITPNGLGGSIKVRFQESQINAFIMSVNYKKNIYY